ncbi:MAG: hypothetical protein ABJQ29_06755 [Luteolibacter sp.]
MPAAVVIAPIPEAEGVVAAIKPVERPAKASRNGRAINALVLRMKRRLENEWGSWFLMALVILI